MADSVGLKLGNYRLIRLLGQGGFADVYLGEHVYLGTQAAIKVLHMQLAHDSIKQFRLEAQIIARLKHPNIIRILDFGVQDGIPFLVMDYASNGTLRQRYPRGTVLPLETVLSCIKQVAAALQYAHDQKLIHRDVKPENMLLGPSNEVLLSDFGIAQVAHSTVSQISGNMAGTVSYMAPEQLQGKPRPATDQYALGVVVYEWLCGDRPFNGLYAEMAMMHITMPPPPLHKKVPGISPTIESVVLKALAKDPKERFASVQAFADALEQASKLQPSQPIINTLPALLLTLPQSSVPSVTSIPPQEQPPQEVLPTLPPDKTIPGFDSPTDDSVISVNHVVPDRLAPTIVPGENKCPYCGAETRPGDKICLSCGNRLLAATPSFDDATIPGSDNWSTPGSPIAPMPSDRTIAESAAMRDDAFPTVQAKLEKIDNPAHFIIRDDKGDILQEYRLEKFGTLIGRAPASDIVLSKDTLTSRRHAVVRYENGNYVISDERSANGTFVNGQQLEELTPRILRDGDHVGIGEYELIFYLSTGVEDLPTIAVPPESEQIDAGTIGTRFMPTVEGQFGTAAAIPMNPSEELAPVDDLKSIALDATASSHPPPSPYSTFALDQTIAQLLEEGELHYKAKRYEDALAAFKRVIQMDSRNARAYGYKGNVSGKLGKYKDALAAYDAALAIDPNHASIWSAKGDVLSKLRRYEGALVAYDGALALNTENARIWTAKGNVLSKLKRYEEALDAYNHALELNTGDAMIWTAEGNVLFKLERYEEALVAYDHALKIPLKKAFIWDAKGEVLYKLKRYEEALEAHNRALALDPYNASISSKCDRLRDLIKHLKEKLAETQVKEKLAEAQAASQANTRVFNAKGVSVNQLGTQQTLHDTSKRQETSELPRQPADGTRVFERFDVFLSHSHLDAMWVEKNLAMRLDNHGFRVWLDKWILVPGEPWQPALARGIEQAHCCVVCIGEQASSGWFQQVIQRAKNRQAHDSSFRVIPVLLPNAKDINIDDFLELNALVDFRNSDFARTFHVLVCGVKGIPPGPPPSERVTSTRTSTTAEEMLQELERLSQSNLITDPVKEEYMRLTMEKVWFAEWTLRLKESTNG